jgi:hypothetical protein|tara:strand:- start:128 stop:700 length:573 start_codon:yes stop_codon:yes gene_type:complete
MAFRKLVGSYKDYNLSTHILEDGYLAVDVDSGSLRLGDGSTAGGTVVGGGGGGSASGLKFGDTTSSTISIADGATLNLVGTGGLTATVSGDTLTIDGSGISSSSLGDLTATGSTLSAPSNADLTLAVGGTGSIVLTGLTFPNSDGSANQIISTNGSGVLSFVDPTAINIDGGTAESTYTSTPSIDGGTAA